MSFLALILFVPWFAILGWAYWAFPASLPRTPARRRFDIAALTIAFALSAIAAVVFHTLATGHGGAIWRQVLASLATYAAFLVVLTVAAILRARRWHVRASTSR